jgi:hypothetical protein
MLMTGNDFAQAHTAAQLAIAWHKKQPKSDFGKREIFKLTDLTKKLDKLLDDHRAIIEATDGECEFEVRDYQDLTPTD